jgi:hypothetical protein
VQVDHIKPKLKPPGTKRLKLKCDMLLSTIGFKCNLRRYTWVAVCAGDGLYVFDTRVWREIAYFQAMVGRCRLTL